LNQNIRQKLKSAEESAQGYHQYSSPPSSNTFLAKLYRLDELKKT
jgi:hypothetical protein